MFKYENNIKDIINIKESIKKYNDSTNLKIIFYPGEKECNKPLETLKTFGYIGINYFFNVIFFIWFWLRIQYN